jgi:hypothetical protein
LLEERERKRERNLVAKGLLRKTEEDERLEKQKLKQDIKSNICFLDLKNLKDYS